MTATESGFDLAIIGSGSAAFAAAIAAVGQGKRVVMAERGITGGTCVNVGCVPSKALLAAAAARHDAATAGRFPGLTSAPAPSAPSAPAYRASTAQAPSSLQAQAQAQGQTQAPAQLTLDFGELIGGKDALVGELRAQKYTDLAAVYGWEIAAGSAAFAGTAQAPVLDIRQDDGGTRRIEAAHYLIATGAVPAVPPIDGLERAGYLTSTTAMELDRLPESMVVVGGSAVGLEMAQLFARLGTRVTVIEALERLAPFEEPESSAAIEDVFADEGIAVLTGTSLTSVRRDDDGYTLTIDERPATASRAPGHETGRQTLRTGHLLIATGRRPATAGLNLGAVGVKTGERGEVTVDKFQRTANERIWAAGDVTGGPQFVYVAAAQGTLATDNALAAAGRTLDYTALPRVTFTTPAIAAAGLTDAEVIEAGVPCDCRVLSLANVPRALASRDTRGLVKLVAEAGSGRLLGVHAVADGAGEIITAASYAIAAGMTVGQLARAWAPYLTMAEALKLAAQSYTTDVARLSCCAA